MPNNFERKIVHANIQDQKRNFLYHIIIKILGILNKDRALKAAREKD